jgi:diguanylate cyclase (GGDEF)-like protein
VSKERAEATRGGGAELLDRFNYLDRSGVLEDLDKVRRENRELDALLVDAASLFSLKGVPQMMDFVISRLLERFIPARLVFLIESTRGDSLTQYCYRNLKPAEPEFPEQSYGQLRHFFLASPFAASYLDIETRLGRSALGAQLSRLEPDRLFPMLGLDGLYGIVILGRKLVGGDYSEVEYMYVDRIVRFLSIGIQNSMHRESAMIDTKTGLYNHAYFMRRLGEELARIARYRETIGVVMIDVDHFKQFNDNWGHLAGDAVLTALADTIKRVIRTEDVAARFGGEEFCIILIQCDELSLPEVAERLRAAIAGMEVDFESKRLSITVSVGCCLVRHTCKLTAAACLERADRALYASKRAGRNRASFYRPGLLDRALTLRADRAP